LLQVDVGGTSHTTILKDYQVHPVRGHLMHLDLQEVDLNQAIRFTVPVQVVGDSPGVKGGGLLTQSVHEVEVETTPAAIPDFVGADVSALEVGDSLSLGELSVPDGASVVGDPALTVISIAASRATRAAGSTSAQAAADGESAEGDAAGDDA
jgi:large subunit ribosomal protein L25